MKRNEIWNLFKTDLHTSTIFHIKFPFSLVEGIIELYCVYICMLIKKKRAIKKTLLSKELRLNNYTFLLYFAFTTNIFSN